MRARKRHTAPHIIQHLRLLHCFYFLILFVGRVVVLLLLLLVFAPRFPVCPVLLVLRCISFPGLFLYGFFFDMFAAAVVVVAAFFFYCRCSEWIHTDISIGNMNHPDYSVPERLKCLLKRCPFQRAIFILLQNWSLLTCALNSVGSYLFNE